MLSREDNDLLTQSDADTPMGELMRRFWLPFLTAEEIAERDGPPLRVQLLGERLIAFRDSNGRVGLVDELCPHRQASLYFGRNEECGIRCVYHGWKFDADGRCIDMPSEPSTSSFRNKIRLRAYPTIERGGLVWAYLGPEEVKPRSLPQFEWLDLPAERRFTTRWRQDCNYAQAMEGDLDVAHFEAVLPHKPAPGYFQPERVPTWKIVEAEYGLICAERRQTGDGQWAWKIGHWLAPFYTMPAMERGAALLTRIWVPADDEHCTVFSVSYRPDAPLDPAELEAWRRGEGEHRRMAPGSDRPAQTLENDYLIDREAQRSRNFTGIEGARARAAMAVESAGPIVDRTREHLGASDAAIVGMRRRLLGAAKMLRDGREPRLPHNDHRYRVRAACAVTPPNIEFEKHAPLREAVQVG